MIQIIGITNDNQLETSTNIHKIDLKKYKWYWVDYNKPTTEEMQLLADIFHFHPLAIEDCIQEIQRPKLDYYDDYTFYVTHIIREDEKTILKDALDFFVGEKFIVTFHHIPSIEVTNVWNKVLALKNFDKWNPYYVFYEVLDKIVDHYFPIHYRIEEELRKLEDNTQKKSMDRLLNELFETRNRLLILLHTVNPMRDLLYRMLNSQHLNLNRIVERKEYFSDIYDHLLKLSEMVASNREVTADIRDSYLSLNSHQTNKIMKTLTIITAIFAPLTFIAGIYGMNFEIIPELTWANGYFYILAVMGVIAISMIIWFIKKGWFD